MALGLIITAQAMAVITLSFGQAFLPFFLADELGITDPDANKLWVGVCTAATPLTVMLLGPVWGTLADRVGQKPMMLRALAGIGVVFLLQAVVTDPFLFAALRLGLGVFAGVNAATIALVTMVVPRERMGMGLGWVQTGRFVGLTAGPALGGFSADLLGHRGAFVLAGIAGVALFLMALWLLPNPPPVVRAGGRGRSLMSGFRYVGGQHHLLVLIALVFITQFGFSMVLPYLPVVIEQMVGQRDNLSTLSGLILSAGSLTAAAAGVTAGWLADRRGYVLLLLASAGASAVLQVLQGVSQTPEQLFLLRFLMGLSFGGIQPLIQALMGLSVPRERSGLVFSVASSAQAGANLAGPIVGSITAVTLGLQAPFFMSAATLVLVALLVSRGVREPAPRHPGS